MKVVKLGKNLRREVQGNFGCKKEIRNPGLKTMQGAFGRGGGVVGRGIYAKPVPQGKVLGGKKRSDLDTRYLGLEGNLGVQTTQKKGRGLYLKCNTQHSFGKKGFTKILLPI